MSIENVFQTITKVACEVLPKLEGHDFKQTDSLRDLGANSVDRSEIVMITLETLELDIPLIEIAGAENMGELAEILHGKLA